jgi:hypothetical protein
MGVTWAPFKSGRTTVRGSYGVFYAWMNANTYEQTLRVDGFRQRELNIMNPSFPDPGTTGTVSRTNRYLLGDEILMPRTLRFSAGIDQTLSPKVRASVSYSHARAAGLYRGRNLNAPVLGVRPDPEFANEIEVVSEGASLSRTLSTNLSLNLAAGVRGASLPRWNPRRTTIRLSYWLSAFENNSDGAFSVPASGTLDTEWGPAPGDRRHRVSASVTTQALKNLNAGVTFNGNTGTPYNITTGFDDNADSIFNDRPAGVGRNTVRTASQATLSANLSYSIVLGPPARAAVQDRREGGANTQNTGRYRLVFTLSVANVTNRANYGGFSGVMTSPFFRTATNVTNPRKVDLGVSLRF